MSLKGYSGRQREGRGGTDGMCVSSVFYRVYCGPCIEKLCGASEVERVSGP